MQTLCGLRPSLPSVKKGLVTSAAAFALSWTLIMTPKELIPLYCLSAERRTGAAYACITARAHPVLPLHSSVDNTISFYKSGYLILYAVAVSTAKTMHMVTSPVSQHVALPFTCTSLSSKHRAV